MTEMTSQQLFNPFPGLRPFRTDEDYLFFGREDQTAELLTLLRMHRLLAVVGTSGSGKSSLVRAGLLPELQGGMMGDAGSTWEILVQRPGGDPIRNLAQALCDAELYDPQDAESIPRLLATLHHSSMGLVEAYRQSDAEQDANLLVVVDQFEELFRFQQTSAESRDQARAYVNLLFEASRQKSLPIYVVVTMRSDYLGDCSQFHGLAEAVNEGEYLIPRLNRRQLQSAIEGPVRVGGGQIANRLVQHLLNDVGDDLDQLPVLQHALMRTWEKWASDHSKDEPLDLRHYEAIGGMQEALSRHADEVYESIPTESQPIAERVFKALTEKGADNRGIRRPRRLAQLADITGARIDTVAEVVNAYRVPGVTFLMPPAPQEIDPQTVIDLSHESLMRVWQRLHGWVEEEAQSARIYRRLADTATLWRDRRASLYHDPDLQIAQSWREEQHPNEAWADQYGGGFVNAMAFLDQSHDSARAAELEKEAARKRELAQAQALAESQSRSARNLKRFAGVLACLMLLAIGMSIWALRLRNVAERHRLAALENAAEAESAREVAIVEANNAKNARRESDRLLIESRHEQGTVWLERSLAQLQQDKHHLAAKLLANRALGFKGFGRVNQDAKFLEQYPILLKPDSEQWAQAERIIRFEPEFPTIWRSPSAALPNGLRDVVFSQDQKLMASCSGNESIVRLWDVESGDQIAELETGADQNRIWRVRFSPDGKLLAVTAENNVRLWDVDKRQELSVLSHGDENQAPTTQNNEELLRALAFSPDGKLLATGGNGRVIYVWDLDANQLVQSLDFERQLRCLTFHPNGPWLAAGGSNGNLQVWDIVTGQQIPSANRPHRNSSVSCLEFSPDGSVLATGSFDNSVALWDATTQEEILRFSYEEYVEALAFSTDGKRLAVGGRDDLVHLIDVEKQEEVATLAGHTGTVRSVRFGPDGEVVSCSADATIRFWDAASGKEKIGYPGHRGAVETVAFNTSGTMLASSSHDDTVRLWDLRTGTESRRFVHDRTVTSACFSPDESRLLTCDWASMVRLWDVATGEEIRRFQSVGAAHVAYNPDGILIAAGLTDGVVRVWHVETGDVVADLTGHTEHLRFIAFSPDGRLLASGGDDATVRIWDVRSHESLRQWDAEQQVDWVEFDPTSTLVAATCGDSVKIWNVNTDEQVAELTGHDGSLSSVTYSHDGRWIASGDYGGQIRLWNASTYEHVTTMEQDAGVRCLAFAPDNRSLASGGNGHGVRLWELLQPQVAQWDTGPAVLDPNGRRIFMAGIGQAKIIDALTDRELALLEDTENSATIRPIFSPDGQYVAALRGGPNGTGQWLWRATGEKVLDASVVLNMPSLRSTFSPDSKLLALPKSDDRTITFFATATGEQQSVLRTEINPYAIAFHPSEELFAVVGDQGAVELWGPSAGSWAKDRDLVGAHGNARCVAFSSDGRLIAVGCNRLGTAFVWELSSGKLFASFDEDATVIEDVAFSPGGDLLAIATRTQAVLRDIASGNLVVASNEYNNMIGGKLSFGPDGTLLASRFRDGTQLLDTRSRRTTTADYASYMRHYRFDARSVSPSPALNLYRQQNIPLRPLSSGNYLSLIQDESVDAQRHIFSSFLRARNLAGAAAVVSKMDAGDTQSERAQLVSAAIETANGFVDQGLPGQAAHCLEITASFAPEGLADLWIARSRIRQIDGDTAGAIALLNERIQQATDSNSGDSADLFALGEERLRLRLAAGDVDMAKSDLEFLYDLPEPPNLNQISGLMDVYLAARIDGQQDEPTASLLAAALIKGFIDAQRSETVNFNQYPELAQLAQLRDTSSSGQTIIAEDVTWQFKDDAAPAADWMNVDFDDSQWRGGIAPLGWPDDGRAKSLVTLGRTTYYFRHTFDVDLNSMPRDAALVLDVMRDDGIIVYLNGQEIWRDNMDQGQISDTDFAQQSVTGTAELQVLTRRFHDVKLNSGTNVMAVELHQSNSTSSDVFWRAKLRAELPLAALIAAASPADLEAALGHGEALLPRQIASQWSEGLRFVYLPELDTDRQLAASSEDWLRRRRIHSALGDVQAAFEATVGEYASLIESEHSTDASVLRRLEIARNLPVLIDGIPSTQEGLQQLDLAAAALADWGDATRDLLGRIVARQMQILLDIEAETGELADRLGAALVASVFTPAQRAEIVPRYLDFVMRSATDEGPLKAADTPALALALSKLYEQALVSSELELATETGQSNWLGDQGSESVIALVERDALGRYWDEVEPPPADWRSLDFDASQWPTGPAPFGFGDDSRGYTKMQSGQLAYYIRYEFDVEFDQLPPAAGLILRIARDDGAVVHLNGEEILRDNMPAGIVDHLTRAISRASAAGETAVHEFDLPDLKSLRDGRNLLAVQVHQTGVNSSDVYIAVALSAQRTLTSVIAQLDEAALRETIAQAREFLPQDYAETWLRDLRFSYQPRLDEESYEGVEPSIIIARARIQSMLGRQDEAARALKLALEHYNDSIATEDVMMRHAIDEDMQRVLMRSGGADDWTAWWRARIAEECAVNGYYGVNCGGEFFVAKDGTVWTSDIGYQTGDLQPIEDELMGVDDTELLATRRWSYDPVDPADFGMYAFPLAAGKYRVSLHFFDSTAPGGRLFDIIIEDKPVLEKFDISRTAGRLSRNIQQFDVDVEDGELNIGFRARPGTPMLSGIEIARQVD